MAIANEKVAHPDLVGGGTTDLHSHAGGGGAAFPVGSVFIAVVSTNPATLLGYGTWSAFAAGRVLVGLDSGDTDFDTVEETGGEKAHTLTTAEMPAHTHDYDSFDGVNQGNDVTGNSDRAITGTTGSTGGDAAHNNLQPYIVVYMWKRTA